jgi:S1-C subfamily serine protease
MLALLLVATAALAGCSAAGQPVPPPRFAAELSDEFAAVVQNVLPSVVEISQPGSVGSGVVFDRAGHIVTNAHVVGTGKAFEVRFANSSTVRQATLVYSYPPEDLAVIKARWCPRASAPRATCGWATSSWRWAARSGWRAA